MIDELLLKKLNYQSNHRGCKESDYVFSRFAKRHLSNMSVDELNLYTELLQENDLDIMDWLMLKTDFPDKYIELKNRLFNIINHKDFN